MEGNMKKTLGGLICALGVIVAGGIMCYFFFPGVIVQTAITVARCSAGLSRQEIQVDDHRWVYVEGGKGEVLLFLHGYGDSKEGWGEFPSAFKDRYRVIIPDLPGFGENSRVQADTYDISNQAKWLDHFVTAIGIKSFHLVGMSMGGGLAAYYAGEHPEKVKSLMIMGPLGVVSVQPSVAWLEYEKDKTGCLCWRTEKEFHRTMGWAFDHPPQMPMIFVDYAIDQGRRHYDFNKKIFNELVVKDRRILENRLSKIMAPTLILWGKNDRILHVSSGEIFRRGIKNSRLEILDCGHMVYLDEPVRTIEFYKDFLKIHK
jgi:abhydrolase domain-containing protein 6